MNRCIANPRSPKLQDSKTVSLNAESARIPQSRAVSTQPAPFADLSWDIKRLLLSTLMSADSRCRRVNSWLSCKRLFRAHPGKAGGAVVEATVDHTLMRGLEPHDR